MKVLMSVGDCYDALLNRYTNKFLFFLNGAHYATIGDGRAGGGYPKFAAGFAPLLHFTWKRKRSSQFSTTNTDSFAPNHSAARCRSACEGLFVCRSASLLQSSQGSESPTSPTAKSVLALKLDKVSLVWRDAPNSSEQNSKIQAGSCLYNPSKNRIHSFIQLANRN